MARWRVTRDKPPLLPERAEQIQHIAQLSVWLPADERALMLAVFTQGQTVADIARLRKARPESVRREVKMLIRRVLNPAFAFALLHASRWDRATAGVANMCIIQGRSVRDAAQKLDISVHTARLLRSTVLTLATLSTVSRQFETAAAQLGESLHAPSID